TGQVTTAAAAIERDLGPVDICVNNAGLIYTVGQLKDMRDEDWELNLAVNVTGTFKVTRAVFPGMRERRWGRLVCSASIAGLMGGFGQTAYATSKVGVIGFAKSVALEGARHNVTCNAIAPGIIAPNASLSPLYDRMVKRVAMQKEGEPEDVASAIAFLCSEPARSCRSPVEWICSRSRLCPHRDTARRGGRSNADGERDVRCDGRPLPLRQGRRNERGDPVRRQRR